MVTMRHNRTNDRERPRGRGLEKNGNSVGRWNRNSSSSDSSKQFILIASCVVLAILCVLLIFQTCKGGRNGKELEPEEQCKEKLVSVQFLIFNDVSQYAIEHPSQYNFEYQTNNNITATATDILNLIVLNANRVYGDETWAVGNTPATSEKRNFVNNNYTCYEALWALVEQWNLQWSMLYNHSTGKYIINIYDQSNSSKGNGADLGNGSKSDPGSGIGYNNGDGKNPAQVSGDHPGSMIISITGLIILLAAYITARVKSKHGELVITANTFDKILILLSPVLFFIAWCFNFDNELSETQIVLLSLSGLMLQGSIIFSIIANKGNWLNITLSILAKLFIFVLTVFILFLTLTILIIDLFLTISSHSSREGTYIVKYDHFLDQWVGYRVD